MRLKLITVAVTSLFALSSVHAATFIAPSSKPGSESLIEQVQAKKKKGPGLCGTNMYWSAKDKKCVDARLKKAK
jgi:hypothetical protein